MKPSDFFSEDYIKVFSPLINGETLLKEVDFIESHIKKPSHILDVCSGHGRHSIELAKRNHKVKGIELNKDAIFIAQKEKEKTKLENVEFIHEDIMNYLPTTEKYDVILLLCNIIGMIKDFDEELLKRTRNSLLEKGKAIISISNRDHILTRLYPNVWIESNGIKYLQSRRFDLEKSELITVDTRIVNGQEHKYQLTQRLYSYHEILSLLKKVGFSDIQIFADFTNTKGTLQSDEFVIVANK